MEFPTSAEEAAGRLSPSPTSSQSPNNPAAAGNSPASPASPSSPVTDTELLQLSLKSAVAAVAAGKATVAANNYALVVKIFFRKCFLLEELVLLALAMGYEARISAHSPTRKMTSETGDAQERQHLQLLPSVNVHDAGETNNEAKSNVDAPQSKATAVHLPASAEPAEQLVDPLTNVGMLLPPGLDEDDYEEERHYYEQKRQREEELSLGHHGVAVAATAARPSQQQSLLPSQKGPLSPPSPSGSSSAASSGKNSSGGEAKADGGGGCDNNNSSSSSSVEDVPGYDAATARWVACLLAKVHPDALPIATLEKLCKVPIPSRPYSRVTTGSVSGGSGGVPSNSASFSSPNIAFRSGGGGMEGGANVSKMAFPVSSAANATTTMATTGAGSTTAAAAAANAFSPNSSNALARLIPHLKTSPASSLPVGNAVSQACSVGSSKAPTTGRGGGGDVATVLGTSSSSSLSLLFATLLWDVACALWNEGFVEDTHHWLSVMDVRRLWRLYADSCANAAAAVAAADEEKNKPLSGGGGSSRQNSDSSLAGLPLSSAGASTLFSAMEPEEEGVGSDERACALSWPAVLAECRAVDEPAPTSRARSTERTDQQQQQQQVPVTTPAPSSSSNNENISTTTTTTFTKNTVKRGEENAREAVQQTAYLPRPRSGITLSALSHAAVPLPMTTTTSSSTTATTSAGNAKAQRGVARPGGDGGGDGPHEKGKRKDAEEESEGVAFDAAGIATETEAAAVVVSPPTSPVTVALQAIPMFVRRLARRASALRDLCGLMMSCETAEDVFYVIYAFHCALETQQRKLEEASRRATAASDAARQPANTRGAAAATSSTATARGGLAEVLMVANLLVEFFLAKRAQKILLDAGLLPSHVSPVSPEEERNAAGAADLGAATASPHHPQHAHRGEHSYRLDRAIRQACDEVVSAFTNGRCLTLYGLESYGIPTPYDCAGSTSSNNNSSSGNGTGSSSGDDGGGGGVQLLAPELPYVLVSNVLSSTLNFAALYRLSRVYHGVMGAWKGVGWHNQGGSHGSGSVNASDGGPRGGGGGVPGQHSNFLAHPNRTRRATEEERLRRRSWTRVPAAKPSAPAAHHHASPHQQRQQQQSSSSASQSVVGELFGFMRDAAAGWRNVASFVRPISEKAEAQMETPTTAALPATTTSVHQDVRPSGIDPEMLDTHRYGSYAERLSEARRAHAAAAAAEASRAFESTPWSAMSPNTVTSNNNSLAEASCSTINVAATTALSKVVPEVQTSGSGACELLLPSHPLINHTCNNNSSIETKTTTHDFSTFSVTTAEGASCTNRLTVSLLAEESEQRMGLSRRPAAAAALPDVTQENNDSAFSSSSPRAAAAAVDVSPSSLAGAADVDSATVLHAPSAQLHSRTPSEAACLRLLTLLYRYPQLHALEPITASHVDLVAKELNKALYILQVAMKSRFGERWWLQWRARREDETQRYYARALADAQRGERALRTGTAAVSSGNKTAIATAGATPSSGSVSNTSNADHMASAGKGVTSDSYLSPSAAEAAATAAAAVPVMTGPVLVSPNSAGVSLPVESARPPSMVGTTPIQPDPSLLLRPAGDDDSMQQPPPFTLQAESPISRQPPEAALWQARQDAGPQMCEFSAPDYSPVPPPSAPLPTPRQPQELSNFWNTRTLSIPTQEGMRERRQNLRGNSVDLFDHDETPSSAAHAGKSAGDESTTAVTETTAVVAADGTVIDVNWDVPPPYTPEVSLDFSAFTTTSVETQEATRKLVETLQRQQHDADDAGANVPGVSLLSRACRRLLHNELPLLQQYSPWRVIYSTRIHGVSLSTLFANCRRESEQHMRLPSGLFSLPSPTDHRAGGNYNSSSSVSSADARPMLLVLELPPSTTLQFAEDDAGVRAALTELRKPLTVEKANRASSALDDYAEAMTFNKLYIGAYLSDLLRLESRRYYGTQDCFVFQLLVPAEKHGNEKDESRASATPPPPPPPQLRVFHASRQNTQFINCRSTSIVIGGGGGGSSLYVDSSLSHGATSACTTFNSPPLSVWQSAAATLCDVADVRQPAGEGAALDDGRQHSLSVLNMEVIVMDA